MIDRHDGWTARDQSRLRRLYTDPDVPVLDIARQLGRSYAATVAAARRIGLQRVKLCPTCGCFPRQPARGTNTGRPAVWSESGHVV
jgi:hypothetical protein